jgi:hypothetical protein
MFCRVPLVFHSSSFIVLSLKFQILIHFELMFMYGKRRESSFFLLCIIFIFPSTIYLFYLFQSRLAIKTWIFTRILCSAPLVYVSIFMPVSLLHWLLQPWNIFEIRYCLQICSFCTRLLWIFGALEGSYKFWDCLFCFCE